VCVSLSGTIKVSTRTLLKTRKLAGIELPIIDLESAQLLLTQSFMSLYEYQQNHTALWQIFVEDLATAKSLQQDSNQSTILKQLMDREHTRRMFRKINFDVELEEWKYKTRHHELGLSSQPDMTLNKRA
jgi:hypothetical protein